MMIDFLSNGTIGALEPSSALSVAKVKGIEKLSQAELYALIQTARRLGIHPDHLAAVIAFETAYTFDPAIKSGGSNGVGLIQFMPDTATSLGTSTAELKNMSVIEQLHYVEKYLQRFGSLGSRVEDVYTAVLSGGRCRGQSHSCVIWSRDSENENIRRYYNANKSLDSNNDGTITLGEATGQVRSILSSGQSRGRIAVTEPRPPASRSGWFSFLAFAAAGGAVAYVVSNPRLRL